METVTVSLGARSYTIYVGSGILGEVGGRLQESGSGERVAVVTNETVAGLYGQRVNASLTGAGFRPVTVEIPDGEEHKNLAWLTLVYDRLIEAGLDRDAALVALGGGVIGDLGGFAAATYLRGISYVQVPTTVVAQVDASVGGKTGVNHVAGKNLIGAFYQPRFVLADVATLRTLPRRHYLAGLAEVVKYGAILDPDLFRLLEERAPAILAAEPALLTKVVRICCTLKAMVVEEDESEHDYRALLNFGHTVGHAIETLTEYKGPLHGEAVAIGMVAGARVSHGLGLCDGRVVERIRRLLRRFGLPTELPRDLRPDVLAVAMGVDKKRREGKVRFVAIEDIGRGCFRSLSAKEIVAHI